MLIRQNKRFDDLTVGSGSLSAVDNEIVLCSRNFSACARDLDVFRKQNSGKQYDHILYVTCFQG